MSTPAVGSSSTITGGACTMAFATNKRRFMPPDRVRAYASALSSSRTAFNSSIVRRFDLGTPYKPACSSNASLGVKKGSNMISCGTIPIDALALRGWASMSKPQMDALPDVFITNPAKILISVDLPAPFGPSKPKIDPCATSKLTSLSACFPPAYFLERFFMEIACSDMQLR